MIIMDIKLDNFLAFNNFHLNLSYPKKIVRSSIESENLQGRENFRYKKVNILMGGNSTGKTAIGRMLTEIFNSISKKTYKSLIDYINDKSKCAMFTIDFVLAEKDKKPGYKLYRVYTKILAAGEKTSNDGDILTLVESVEVGEHDKYETCAKRLSDVIAKREGVEKPHYAEELQKITMPTCSFMFTGENLMGEELPGNFEKILEHTLRCLDPAILKVKKLDGADKAYIVSMANRDLIIRENEAIEGDLLSSGAKAGMGIAYILSAIKAKMYSSYYCDEKFSNVHSDIEKAFLSLMISSLGENSQLFFTTHNLSILDLDLPKHSYTFLKKDVTDDEQPIKCISASQYLKKNTQSLRNAVENDLFSVAPSLDLVYEMEEA